VWQKGGDGWSAMQDCESPKRQMSAFNSGIGRRWYLKVLRLNNYKRCVNGRTVDTMKSSAKTYLVHISLRNNSQGLSLWIFELFQARKLRYEPEFPLTEKKVPI